ncbi:MAG: RnfABCDGE type electron transport complex subunit B [Oscillospiraceae bacterium]|nr:RnfABCDGE type electron transport complex subunit B [Oscillospiraceae bacterium]
MYETILYSVLSVGAIALVFGLILGFSAKKLSVKPDVRVDQIFNILPGANCGGCGFPGCAVFAENVASGKASHLGCPPAGPEGAMKIAEFLGIDADEINKNSAYVKCRGTDDNIKRNYYYDGPKSCVAASQLAAGSNKSCTYGCIGLSSCENVCLFGAIEIVNSVAVINKNKCTACGKCVAVCPKNLIEITNDANRIRVLCNSRDKGKLVRENCRAGCFGCNICQNNCETGAITVSNNIASIDYDKCTMCMKCVDKCPAKSIKAV